MPQAVRVTKTVSTQHTLNLLDEGDVVKKGFKVEKKPYAEALEFACRVRDILTDKFGIQAKDVHFGGSLRRQKPLVGDLDIAICDARVNAQLYRNLLTAFAAAGHTVKIRVLGDSQCSAVIDDFLLELKRCEPSYLGAMLLFITGPGEYNVGMRAYAKANGFSLNQYGLFKRAAKGEDGVVPVCDCSEERFIFGALGLPYEIPQERNFFNPPTIGFRVPQEVLDRLPPAVIAALDKFELPEYDDEGKPIPRDFLWNKTARQGYYKRAGRFKLPDELKLDRY